MLNIEKMAVELPNTLIQNLADSEVEVVSWSASSQELVLLLRKDLNREIGTLHFSGVSRVVLVPRFSVASISTKNSNPAAPSADAGETVFNLQESWGENYYVVAESISYITSE